VTAGTSFAVVGPAVSPAGATRSRLRRLAVVLALVTAGGMVAACEPTLFSETGVIVSIDSPALGRVDGFELRTGDGRVLAFDTRDLRFDPGFPAAHLSEHLLTTEPVRVTYRRVDDRNVVVRLADAPD
jgi:hypothetical protein